MSEPRSNDPEVLYLVWYDDESWIDTFRTERERREFLDKYLKNQHQAHEGEAIVIGRIK